MASTLGESFNHCGDWRSPWGWWKWKLYEHTLLFFSVNFRYLCYKGRDNYRVDDMLYFVIESKCWWWSVSISPSIFHILFLHYTTLFVTEMLPIVIGIGVNCGNKVRMHYLKLVWIVLVLSTPSSARMDTSSSASTLESVAMASSSDSSIKFSCVGCP